MAERPNRVAADLREAIALALRDLNRLAAEATHAGTRLGSGASTLEIFGAGAIAHGYYTHLEKFLERLVRDLNSAPLEGPDWHRRLLQSMTLDKPGLRPPLFTAEQGSRLDELLRFRHLFRNLYVLDLASQRVGELLETLLSLHPEIVAALRRFDGFLESIERAS